VSRFSFSFADYYNPNRLWFGALRVINDDIIDPNSGFGMHQHRDMEIITLVFSGELTHTDSMGNMKTIQAGEVQIMSAGTGIFHSEINQNQSEAVHLLQIWITPFVRGISPRYGQMKYTLPPNTLVEVVTWASKPDWAAIPQIGQPLVILQYAKLFLGKFDEGKSFSNTVPESGGVYVMVVEGTFELNGQVLQARDAIEITEPIPYTGTCLTHGLLLVIEVPIYR